MINLAALPFPEFSRYFKKDDVIISFEGDKMSIDNKFGEVREKIIDANYPDWKQTIPKTGFSPSMIPYSKGFIPRLPPKTLL